MRKKALFIGVMVACIVATAYESGAMTFVRMEQVPSPLQQINLAEWLAAGKLRPVNRGVTRIQESPDAVHVDEKAGPGIAWLKGSDLADGTIEVDVRGRDVFQQSFVGVAFHGQNNNTYEAVYVRPFNFHVSEPIRHKHAVQYMALPDYDWPRLRQEFPDEFESSIDPSLAPVAWVHLRIVLTGKKVQAYVGPVSSPTLQVRKLGQYDRGMVGLWTGNHSNGDFAHLRMIPRN